METNFCHLSYFLRHNFVESALKLLMKLYRDNFICTHNFAVSNFGTSYFKYFCEAIFVHVYFEKKI